MEEEKMESPSSPQPKPSSPMLTDQKPIPIPPVFQPSPIPDTLPALPPPKPPVLVPPLAPIPTRPPIPKPSQNSEPNNSDSDSDHHDSAAPLSLADYEISEESKLVRERQEKAMQELLTKRRAFALASPTNDSVVRARLCWLGETVTLFGEQEMERRDRLRMIMVKLDSEGQLEKLLKAHEEEEMASGAVEEDEGEGPQVYPFYTEGLKALLDARMEIAKYSIVKAALRLERPRRRRDDPDEDLDAEMDFVLKQVGSFVLD